MEHKQTHVDLSVDTSCGQEVDLYHFFPTCAGISPLVYMYQPPPSSWASPLALLMASTRGPKYLSGWVWILIEGGYYFIQHRQSCGYYSGADTIRHAGTIRGNTVTVKYLCKMDTYCSLIQIIHKATWSSTHWLPRPFTSTLKGLVSIASSTCARRMKSCGPIRLQNTCDVVIF